MTSPYSPTALDFLPPKVATKPLYQFLGPVIDRALTPTDGVNDAVVDPLVSALLLNYQDAEAVNAYLNILVHPIVGTRKAIDYAFQLLNISPALVEWWQPKLMSPYDTVQPTGQSDKPFHFTVTFPDGTLPRGAFSYRDLIDMILALKNERSRLVSIRMADCVDMLTLDNDCILDMYWLDDLEGFVDPDTGVNICLHDNVVEQVNAEERVAGHVQTSQTVQVTCAFLGGLLDFTVLDESADLDDGSIQAANARTSSQTIRKQYALVNFDPITGISTQPVGRTWNIVGVAGGPDVATTQHTGRTADRGQSMALALTPKPSQTISGRSVTSTVPRQMIYQQMTWVDQPDGVGRAWNDQPLTWLSDQPQGFCHHTQEIVTGYALGSGAAALGRPSATGSGFYGTQGSAAVRDGRPTVAGAGTAPPSGNARATLGRPTETGTGVVGVRVQAIVRGNQPRVSGRGLMVPVGNGLASLPRMTADAEGLTSSS